MALYFRHLKPEGVPAPHASDQYLDLAAVVAATALEIGKEPVRVENQADGQRGVYRAIWVMVGNPKGVLGKSEIESAGTRPGPGTSQLPWTDDYNSIFRALR